MLNTSTNVTKQISNIDIASIPFIINIPSKLLIFSFKLSNDSSAASVKIYERQ